MKAVHEWPTNLIRRVPVLVIDVEAAQRSGDAAAIAYACAIREWQQETAIALAEAKQLDKPYAEAKCTARYALSCLVAVGQPVRPINGNDLKLDRSRSLEASSGSNYEGNDEVSYESSHVAAVLTDETFGCVHDRTPCCLENSPESRVCEAVNDAVRNPGYQADRYFAFSRKLVRRIPTLGEIVKQIVSRAKAGDEIGNGSGCLGNRVIRLIGGDVSEGRGA